MAQFEWHVGLAFDAADMPAIAAGDLAQVPPEAWGELGLVLQPGLQPLRLDFAVPAWWRGGQGPDAAAAHPPAAGPLAAQRRGAAWGERVCDRVDLPGAAPSETTKRPM